MYEEQLFATVPSRRLRSRGPFSREQGPRRGRRPAWEPARPRRAAGGAAASRRASAWSRPRPRSLGVGGRRRLNRRPSRLPSPRAGRGLGRRGPGRARAREARRPGGPEARRPGARRRGGAACSEARARGSAAQRGGPEVTAG